MWVFSESPLRGIQKTSELDFATGQPQALRVKWLMHVLERNPNWKSTFQTLIQSVVVETRVFELLVSMGLHQHSSLISEFFERFQRRILPRPPDDQNLEMLFNLSFDDESDAVAIARIDRLTFSQIAKLLTDSSARTKFLSNWQEDCFNSTAHLSLQIAALGSHPALRARSLDQSRGPTSFARLQLLNLEWLLQGFSLATKQPAMTAATLANQIQAFDDPVQRAKDDHEEKALQPIVNEVLALFRSQTLAVAGNLLAVIPGVFLLCGTFDLIVGQPFISKEKASKTLESISLLGPTPLYAAWTGVLLFTSSLIAGWLFHWVMFRRLPQAFARSPRICSVLGTERARKTSFWFRKNSAGLAANISLGFLLPCGRRKSHSEPASF
jgi:site-specific recombinase